MWVGMLVLRCSLSGGIETVKVNQAWDFEYRLGSRLIKSSLSQYISFVDVERIQRCNSYS